MRMLRRIGYRSLAIGLVVGLGVGAGGVAVATHVFPDVPDNTFYADPVEWANQHGITTGVGDTGEFRPHEQVTRAQAVTFLHRYHSRLQPSATLSARVNADGTLASGVRAVASGTSGAGYLVRFDRSVHNCAWTGTAVSHATDVPPPAQFVSVARHTTNNRLRVHVHDSDGNPTLGAFHLAVTCVNPN